MNMEYQSYQRDYFLRVDLYSSDTYCPGNTVHAQKRKPERRDRLYPVPNVTDPPVIHNGVSGCLAGVVRESYDNTSRSNNRRGTYIVTGKCYGLTVSSKGSIKTLQPPSSAVSSEDESAAHSEHYSECMSV